MRRVLCLIPLMLALLLLAGCGSRFALQEDGYTDTKTDRHYVALSSHYEADGRSEEIGTYEDKENGKTVTFYQIIGADASRFLTDGEGFVYCADASLPDASRWEVGSILVCGEDAVSAAKARLSDADVVAAVQQLWFSGEDSDLPLGERAKTMRRLKMVSPDCPGVYYCFYYYIYEDGSAYFYSVEGRRTVSVPAELVEKITLG